MLYIDIHSKHTLNKDLLNQCLIKLCLGNHVDPAKGRSVFQLRILQSW